MAYKITPKNLTYDNSLPPFLARLQASNSSSSRDGRHERSTVAARPKKERSREEIEEDEPVYFDEGTGENLTRAEWEGREERKDDMEKEREVVRGVDGRGEGGKEMDKERLAATIGVSKKRKAGRVVGASDGDDGGVGEESAASPATPSAVSESTSSRPPPKSISTSTSTSVITASNQVKKDKADADADAKAKANAKPPSTHPNPKPTMKKATKKTDKKKIKLSFGDE